MAASFWVEKLVKSGFKSMEPVERDFRANANRLQYGVLHIDSKCPETILRHIDQFYDFYTENN